MTAETLLTEERRARMAAERLLAQKESELNAANRMLSRHALSLSEDLVETREEVEAVKGENTRVRADLERANTEIVIAKRRLWNSIQSIEDGFAVFDADSRMVIANTAYLLPFDGLECIRPGVHYQEVVEAALAEGVVDIEGKTPAQWREEMLARWFSPTPEPRVIRLWDGTWVRLVDHRAPGGDTVCLHLNITEAMNREAALEAALDKAEAANRAKSAFLANMSHEIRTPMNGVVGMADLLAESGLDGDQTLYVDTIRSSGQALLAIINDVLDYSKIGAEKLVLHSEPFDLEGILLEVIQLLEPSVREKNLRLMLDYDMFLPTCFEGDPVRIRQILTNIVGNAVKFTEKGHVLVRAFGEPAGNGTARSITITVEDTGIGIPKDMIEHVFGEFNQAEDERNRAYEGTGLGLAITRQLAGLMGGTVWAESEPGVGSVFSFRCELPVVGTFTAPELPGWIGRALLVMKDDFFRSVLERRLAALGLSVDCAASAAEVTTARASAADVVFADQNAGDRAISRFIDVIREGGSLAPVLLLTTPSENAPASSADVAGLLQKPVTRRDLIEALKGLTQPAPLLLTEGLRQDRAPQPRPASHAPATERPAESPVPTPVFGSRRRPSAPSTPEPEAPQPVFGSRRRPQAESSAPVSTPPATAETPARKMRILAAEDNKTNQLVFSKLVKSCAIELRFANNGEEAVNAFREQVPDLIFMDISMPGMDGKEATRIIRAIEAEKGLPRTRIVALTAHAMTGDAEEILSHGLDEHLTKPFKKPAIYAEIENACPADARPPLPSA